MKNHRRNQGKERMLSVVRLLQFGIRENWVQTIILNPAIYYRDELVQIMKTF